ncbi:MAG: 50S ribosomal protein L4 [Candidatus Paceibacterota bacterium]
MKADVYNQEGKKVSTVDLPESLFARKWNADLVHQVVVSMESNARRGTASVKGRREVSGGGRKPWRQKGTGRARHGSRRSPIWVGGGVAHGPTNEKDYTKKINKKMRARALASVLSEKYRNNQVLFLDSLSFEEPKTKEAKKILSSLSSIEGFEKLSEKKKNAAILSLRSQKENVKKSFQNFASIEIRESRALNPSSILSSTYLIIEDPENSLSDLESRLN